MTRRTLKLAVAGVVLVMVSAASLMRAQQTAPDLIQARQMSRLDSQAIRTDG